MLGGRPSIGGRSLAKAITMEKEMYSFPILEPTEVVEVLREMGVAVVEDDISKPKPDIFRQWCELFIMEILGMEQGDLYRPVQEFVPTLDGNEELHGASVPVVHFITLMNKMLHAAHCPEGLSMRDLIKPERARVLRILSALINLQKFKVEKLIWYQNLEMEKAMHTQGITDMNEKLTVLRNAIQTEMLNRQNEQAVIDGVTEDCMKLEAARDELYARIAAKEKENETLKASILNLREEKASLDQQVIQKKEEIGLTRAFVVESPEQLLEQERQAEQQLKEESDTLRDIENNNKLLDRQIEVVAKANKDVAKAIQLLESVEMEASKLKRVIREEKSKREELDAIQMEEKALSSNLEVVLSQKKRAEKRLAEIKKSLDEKIETQHKALEQIRKEIEDYTNMAREATDTRSSSESEYMRLQRKKDALIAAHTAEVSEITESLKRLHTSVEGYHNSLYRGMASISSDSRDFLTFSKNNETS